MTNEVIALHQNLASAPIVVDGHLRVEDVAAVAAGRSCAVPAASLERCAASVNFLEELSQENRIVYGYNTGFGPMAHFQVNKELAHKLQRNLLTSLSSGLGELCTAEEGRAVLCARLNSLSQGYSAVHPVVLETIVQWLNAGLAPAIPLRGTVGASGDLTPLAHLGRCLMGEGHVWLKDELLPAAEGIERTGVPTYEPAGRDSLGLVNGVSAMTGVAALNAVKAERLWNWAVRLGALHAEVFGAYEAAFQPLVGEVRPQPGILHTLAALNAALQGSGATRPFEPLPPFVEAPSQEQRTFDAGRLPQDHYSIRCMPQLLGAAWDMIAFHRGVVETDLNGVTDNPIIDAAQRRVVHAGNFQGQHVGFASDTLAIAIVQMAVLSERQITRITDPVLNNGLPAFLQADDTGLQSGFQGAQVTSSATLAEMRTLALPASCQSIPTNGNNQDVVSMGTIAARKTARLLQHWSELLSIQAMVTAQAVDIRRKEGVCFSPAGLALQEEIRQWTPWLGEDRPLREEIEALAAGQRAAAPRA
jgi:tyrosine ammonia-lyase